ncbi:retinol dehydrogenase 10-like [Eublepharis macularius]|uniref:Short-chain dehydrogenase/reductase 3 n=1 Tax=Eublepharis macularius TaxID=481883 RepID=A0AA97L0F9_EUBMA|nr:retinol dehydrogenase 10-like [Eublepharis macularius]
MAVLADFLILTVKIFECIIHSLLQWVIKPPEKTVTNEICLITGAASASGVGHLLALEFAKRGATLVLWDVDSEGNENTAREARELGVRAYAYTCDVSRREEVYAIAEKVKRDVGEVTILVNNASIITQKPILQFPDELLERTMRTNCHAHFWTVKAFLPQMIQSGHGHIVTIAGSLGLFATGCMEGYCASKFAVVGFHEALSHELKAQGVSGVKTTLVCPYFGDIGLSESFRNRQEATISPLKPGSWVKSAMQGILRNQPMICVPRGIYFAMITKNFLPCDVQVLVQKLLRLDKYIPQEDADTPISKNSI